VLHDASFPSIADAEMWPAEAALPSVTLVLGGVRSGKSRFAQSLVERAGGGLYLATAQAGDAEMAARIREHRSRRGKTWAALEEPLELTAALRSGSKPGRPVLVDCLTLWLSNLIHAGRDIAAETDALVSILPELDSPAVFVSNEVGLGIVPENALARAFRDQAGLMNQRVADAADLVVFMAAGLPLALKKPA
jgi:adenosylcobinamide kinase / adenosylcobinamide-phosphate guanylyltransferase